MKKNNAILKKIKAERHERALLVHRASLNSETRIVELAFSSEDPVERWFGNEILDHDPKSVRLERMQAGGALLVDHNPTDHVGVVESVTIDEDRVGRVSVRFGKSARAEEIYNDVMDGIRRHVSVGYRVHKAVMVEMEGDEETYRVTDWEPLEVSFVSIPADTTVGVGRSDPTNDPEIDITKPEDKEMDPKKEDKKEEQTPPVDVKKVRAEARKEELERIRDIEAAAKKFGHEKIGREFIDNGLSFEEFRAKLLDSLEAKNTPTPSKSPADLDLSNKDARRYSLLRAISAHHKGDWKGAEFERECSIAISDNLGREARGFFIPFDIQSRDLNVGVAADGGALKGTDHLAGSFIESLRATSLIGQLGATFLPGLVGDVDIPKQIGSAAFYWLAEAGNVTDSDPQFATVNLAPKTVAGAVPMSRKLLKQSAPSIEGIVMQDLVAGAALAIDAAAFEGSGAANQPTGIVNQSGINTVTVVDVGGVPTFTETVAFETAIANDNALTGSLSYVTTPTIIGGLKTTPKDAGAGIFVSEGGQINGYPAHSTTNITAGTTIFGNFADLLVGLWGVLDVDTDKATNAASGGLVLRVFQDIDIAIRHPESFAKSA